MNILLYIYTQSKLKVVDFLRSNNFFQDRGRSTQLAKPVYRATIHDNCHKSPHTRREGDA